MEISVIIPAYNEEKVIRSSIKSIISYMNENFKSYEIIVVDDGSTDKTPEILREFSGEIRVLTNTKNMGKGYCVKKGVMYAKGDKIVFTDADMAYPQKYIKEFSKVLDSADMVIGKRDSQKNAYPFYRRVMSSALSYANKLIFSNIPSDTQCGIKGFRRATAKSVFDRCTINGFAFDIEIICIANELGKSIREFPVEMSVYEKSKVNPITEPYKILSDIAKIKLNLITGYYTRYAIIQRSAGRLT